MNNYFYVVAEKSVWESFNKHMSVRIYQLICALMLL